MKKQICLLITLMLLATCSSALAQSPSLPACALVADTLSPTPVESKLLRDWEASLAWADDLYAKLEWALAYVDAWADHNSWENLCKAKAACVLLGDCAAQKPYPALSLTTAEQAELAGMGYEIMILQDYTLQYENIANLLVPTVSRNIFALLEEDAHYAYHLKTLKEYTKAIRKTVDYDTRYTQLSTNALFVPLYRQKDADTFWNTLQKSYPMVFRKCDPWRSEHEPLEKAVRKHAQKYDDPLSSAFDRALARKENSLTDLKLGRKIKTISISGAPDGFPVPEWHYAYISDYVVYRYGSDGSVSYPVCGGKLTKADCCLYVQQPGITLRQVQDYAALLLGPENVDPSDTHWNLKNDGGTELDIEWKNQTVTFRFPGESTCFLPLDLF